jgi:hypothetical protein
MRGAFVETNAVERHLLQQGGAAASGTVMNTQSCMGVTWQRWPWQNFAPSFLGFDCKCH